LPFLLSFLPTFLLSSLLLVLPPPLLTTHPVPHRRAQHQNFYALKDTILNAQKQKSKVRQRQALAAAHTSSEEGHRQGDGDNTHAGTRVGVVGAGIAGAACAWSLNRSGFDVTLFEKRPTLGGNAKKHTWVVPTGGGNSVNVDTGLSVLAWPDQFFHNYNCLVKTLGMEWHHHDLKFFVAEKSGDGEATPIFVHGKSDFSGPEWLAADLKKWASLVGFVRSVNAFFQPADKPSVYRNNLLNPLNLIPLRFLCRLFSVSHLFWERVFVPVHTSTFLESKMDTIPAVIAELLEDMIPLTAPHEKIPAMATWTTNATEVFFRMSTEFPEGAVRTSAEVEKIRFATNAEGNDVVYLTDDDGSEGEFDHVVFACPAPAIERALEGAGDSLGINGLTGNLELFMLKRGLGQVIYTESRDKLFLMGQAHSDAAAVFPPHFKEELCQEYCNYIEVDPTRRSAIGLPNYENTFILSSWAPPMQEASVRGKRDMLVSYNCDAKLAHSDEAHLERGVTSREGHPCLTTTHMAMSNLLWPGLQGSQAGRVFFCGSAVTAGNGHDLSMLSGLVVAHEIGAKYPFQYDAGATEDFQRLQGMMLWDSKSV
jgi:predicted NAD/FAD-binding protein